MTNPKPQIKKRKFWLKAKDPCKIETALESWVDASDKIDSDRLKLDEAPAWVENAFFEVAKVVMPSNKMPTDGESDLELIGELIGRIEALGKLHGGQIPMGSEMKAEVDQIKKHAASLPKSKERTAREKILKQDWQARVEATNEAIPNLIKAALASSHEDALKFQKGLLRGMNLASDELTAGQVLERHTRTFFVLAVQWRRFSKCRSLREIHGILCEEIGKDKIGSFKTFENRVAKKIGLKVRGRGRPPKK